MGLLWHKIFCILGHGQIYGMNQSQKSGKVDNSRHNGRRDFTKGITFYSRSVKLYKLLKLLLVNFNYSRLPRKVLTLKSNALNMPTEQIKHWFLPSVTFRIATAHVCNQFNDVFHR